MIVDYTTQVAAGAVVPNILVDTMLATAPGPGMYYVRGRNGIALAGVLRMTAKRVNVTMCEALTLNLGAGGPVIPDDDLVQFPVAGGETVLISLTETGGAAAADPNVRVEYKALPGAGLT